MKVLKFVAVCAAVWTGLIRVQGQNLLENGSFEISNSEPGNSVQVVRGVQINSWQIGPGNNGIVYVGTLMPAAEGQRSLHLQFLNTGNYIEQKLATVPGQGYRVYWDASVYVGPQGEGGALKRGQATARSTGDSIIAQKDFSHDGTGKSFATVGWSAHTMDFVADAAETVIRLQSREETGGYGPMIDNVRVVPGREENGQWVISGPPVFTRTLPATSQAVVGRPLRMEVEATGDAPLSYQWFRVSNASVYTPIADATAAVYEIASFSNSQNGLYAVVVSNALASTTNRTSVVRVSPPGIGEIEEQHVSEGSALNFGPKNYVGGVPDRFQWYKDGTAVEGQTNATFTKASAELNDAGTYYLWGANIAGETRSADVQVLVFEGGVPPWIRFNQLPPERAIQEGGSLFVTVGGAGASPLTYLFYKGESLLESTLQNNWSKNGITSDDAGLYSVVLSNQFGMMTSAVMNVIVYPPQEFPIFSQNHIMTNVAEGAEVMITPPLTQGSHLVFQWYKRPMDVFEGLGEPLAGATALSLDLGTISYDQQGYYTLVATNFVGSNKITYQLSVIAKPILATPLQGFEGPENSFINLSVNIQNWSPGLTYQWHRNGEPIPSATQSTLPLSVNASTTGNYSVVVKNEAGETTSNTATVSIRPVTPADREYHLVANYTVDAPDRPGLKLTVVGDAHLRDHVVTFQSVTNHEDVGGLYRWYQGKVETIVDLNDMLPSFTSLVNWYDGLSAEEGGIATFIAEATNSPANKRSVFAKQGEGITPLFTQQDAIPGKPGVTASRFGYTARAGGKSAFFAMANDSGSGGYRCVLVWDGQTLQNWVSSDQPLPAGDGVWWGNSSQVGFDGSTLAFWATDQTGGDNGSRNGIFVSVNGGPLQKIAFAGDPIPGGLGTFKGFNSPPRVHDGKVLFLGQPAVGSGNFLLEYAGGTLRVLAKSGDTPSGAGALNTIAYGFDYLADGSVLFSANGPGQKQGIYKLKDGMLTEVLTTLNTIDGRVLRFVSLYDADGSDLVIGSSFDGSRFSLYTTAWGEQSLSPEIAVTRSATSMTLTWSGAGVLQESGNLRDWSDVAEPSPYQVQFSASSGKYYRIIER